ncbi:AbrB/MazE/SpoVT family DNA-binding domain-containing protein [Fulvimarina endophytica]|uniref:AbrB/MazE/SpoVT family DNA-binding domain-containing protein n=1 Tax=Fulvimarina endophytica TaxID=2293836 RepID=A0A371WYK4_9HYPH|nr:AbrB/MazE/SpoVT family DNA-binding domain-containing protein [Fulvimarina endophytica]RFC61844.1 AbrB/MazE/SpoVT family DNA-binding domain-containing protein [Fulvimarina endophytica]
MSIRLHISENGRLSLPVALRRRYGLDKGGDVIVEDHGDRIVIHTVDQAVKHAQAMSRKLIGDTSEASVDDFIADRRRQAETE